jgi:hypothetical protein
LEHANRIQGSASATSLRACNNKLGTLAHIDDHESLDLSKYRVFELAPLKAIAIIKASENIFLSSWLSFFVMSRRLKSGELSIQRLKDV